jgi:hypothetical protein
MPCTVEFKEGLEEVNIQCWFLLKR